MNDEINIQDILQKLIGEENGVPKAGITMSVALIDEQKNIVDAGNYSSYKSIVDIIRLGDYIQLDLKFKSSLDGDLSILWNILEDYAYKINHTEEFDDKEPFVSITLVSSDLLFDYFITITNPIFWSLQPEKPNEPNNIIRMCFCLKDLLVYKSNVPAEQEIENINKALLEEENYYSRYHDDYIEDDQDDYSLYDTESGHYTKNNKK